MTAVDLGPPVLVKIQVPIAVPAYPRITMNRVQEPGKKTKVFMGNAKGHARLTEFYRDLGLLLPARVKVGMVGPIVVQELDIALGSGGRGDLDNYLKSAFDGFTKVGIWKDDRYVDEIHCFRRLRVPKGKEYLRAVITGHRPTRGKS